MCISLCVSVSLGVTYRGDLSMTVRIHCASDFHGNILPNTQGVLCKSLPQCILLCAKFRSHSLSLSLSLSLLLPFSLSGSKATSGERTEPNQECVVQSITTNIKTSKYVHRHTTPLSFSAKSPAVQGCFWASKSGVAGHDWTGPFIQ